MKQRSNDYWERRALQRMASYQRDAEATIWTIMQAYDKAIQEITEEIERIFNKFAKDGQLLPDEARKLLNEPISRKEWEEIKAKIAEIKDPQIRRQLLNRLNAPAYRARITRLQALKEQIYLQCKIIADAEIRASTEGYIGTINEAYYRTMFDIQRGLGVGFEFAAMPTRTVEAILKNPWSGKHFSARIWGNTDELARLLEKVITSGFMSGVGVRKMTQEIQERFDVGKHAAARLVRTETTYMANAAEMESYEEAEIDRYVFVATLDLRTSPQCRAHDRKVYAVKDAKPGVNMPPLHPYCRSTTRAYFGSDTLKNVQRRARDPVTGKTYLVPADMSYEQWRQSIVDKHGQDRIEVLEKQIRNKAADKRQYEEIKALIGPDAPKSFSKFQELKYNKVDEWAATKRQVATFRIIETGPYSDAYKEKLKATYRYFRKDGYEFTTHALNRVLGQKTGKGKRPFTREEVKAMLGKPPNYRQPDGKLVRYENGLAVIQAPDTGEFVSVISRPKPRKDWKEV